ncbi:MAG: NAD-dependent epimerase/dehydratase family protein [Caldimonas sp.]
MDLLLLGGGVFLGAAVVDHAASRGHRVTVFNRGRSRRHWPAGVEAIVGDRGSDLGRLQGRHFDAVVDTCGYVPAEVGASAEALAAVGCYCFISSISAYDSFGHAGVVESDPLSLAEGIDAADRDLAHYGSQKAACEQQVASVFGERTLIVRPGLIVGPGDRSGRFSHWPWRAMAGGAMLVPDAPADAPLQFIDVRDLGEWIVRLLERGDVGVYNATGPVGRAPYSWPELAANCIGSAAAHGAPAIEVVGVDEAALLAAGVTPWSELPLWLPSTDADYHGFLRVDVARAVATGLSTRPLPATIAAVLGEGVPPADDERRAGKLSREREAELIAGARSDTTVAADP